MVYSHYTGPGPGLVQDPVFPNVPVPFPVPVPVPFLCSVNNPLDAVSLNNLVIDQNLEL